MNTVKSCMKHIGLAVRFRIRNVKGFLASSQGFVDSPTVFSELKPGLSTQELTSQIDSSEQVAAERF